MLNVEQALLKIIKFQNSYGSVANFVLEYNHEITKMLEEINIYLKNTGFDKITDKVTNTLSNEAKIEHFTSVDMVQDYNIFIEKAYIQQQTSYQRIEKIQKFVVEYKEYLSGSYKKLEFDKIESTHAEELKAFFDNQFLLIEQVSASYNQHDSYNYIENAKQILVDHAKVVNKHNKSRTERAPEELSPSDATFYTELELIFSQPKNILQQLGLNESLEPIIKKVDESIGDDSKRTSNVALEPALTDNGTFIETTSNVTLNNLPTERFYYNILSKLTVFAKKWSEIYDLSQAYEVLDKAIDFSTVPDLKQDKEIIIELSKTISGFDAIEMLIEQYLSMSLASAAHYKLLELREIVLEINSLARKKLNPEVENAVSLIRNTLEERFYQSIILPLQEQLEHVAHYLKSKYNITAAGEHKNKITRCIRLLEQKLNIDDLLPVHLNYATELLELVTYIQGDIDSKNHILADICVILRKYHDGLVLLKELDDTYNKLTAFTEAENTINNLLDKISKNNPYPAISELKDLAANFKTTLDSRIKILIDFIDGCFQLADDIQTYDDLTQAQIKLQCLIENDINKFERYLDKLNELMLQYDTMAEKKEVACIRTLKHISSSLSYEKWHSRNELVKAYPSKIAPKILIVANRIQQSVQKISSTIQDLAKERQRLSADNNDLATESQANPLNDQAATVNPQSGTLLHSASENSIFSIKARSIHKVRYELANIDTLKEKLIACFSHYKTALGKRDESWFNFLYDKCNAQSKAILVTQFIQQLKQKNITFQEIKAALEKLKNVNHQLRYQQISLRRFYNATLNFFMTGATSKPSVSYEEAAIIDGLLGRTIANAKILIDNFAAEMNQRDRVSLQSAMPRMQRK